MKKEQIERLQETENRLLDVFLEEANPDSWPGAGVPLAQLSKSERGDRYWHKKNCLATLTVVMRIEHLIEPNWMSDEQKRGQDDHELDEAVELAEKEADKLLKKFVKA
jgi:hypothetical protein